AKGVDLSLFNRLGISSIVQTSATQNRGINNLLEELTKVIPKAKLEDNDDRLTVAIVGRPNVGKSNLFNSPAKKQQAIVAEKAGTTRDINRTLVKYKTREFEL